MKHTNNRSQIATLLAIGCFYTATLFGNVDRIWHTYDGFLNKEAIRKESHAAIREKRKEQLKKEEQRLHTEVETQKKRVEAAIKDASSKTATEEAAKKAKSAAAIEEAKQEALEIQLQETLQTLHEELEAGLDIRADKAIRANLAPYERLAPIHGAAMWILFVAQHLYDLAHLYDMNEGIKLARETLKKSAEKKEAVDATPPQEAKAAIQEIKDEQKAEGEQKAPNEEEEKAISSILRPLVTQKAPASIQLVHAIFNRPILTTTAISDFGLSNRLSCCTPEVIAAFVGKVLTVIEKAIQKKRPSQPFQFTLQKGVRTWIEQRTQENTIKPTITDANINTTKQTLQTILNLAIKAFVDDSSGNSPFPPHTVHLILLALLYKHTNLEPHALATYYQEIAIIDPSLSTLTKKLNLQQKIRGGMAKELATLKETHKKELSTLERQQKEQFAALKKEQTEATATYKQAQTEEQVAAQKEQFAKKNYGFVVREIALKKQQKAARNALEKQQKEELRRFIENEEPKTRSAIKRLKENLLAAGKVATAESKTAVIELIHRTYEEIAFLELRPKGDLPPSFEYSDYTNLSAFSASTNQFTPIQAPDSPYASCMENVVRQIMGVLTHNKKTKLHSIQALTNHLEGGEIDSDDESDQASGQEKHEKKSASAPVTAVNLDPAFIAFFTKHSDPTKASLPLVHDDWSAVVSNIPYVAYTRNSTTRTLNNWPGYIRIPGADLKVQASLETFLNSRRYTTIQNEDKEAFLYEMQPSFRNLIIIINHLLNLNLFEDKLAEVFSSPDFVKTYLPKLLAKLNATIEPILSAPLDALNEADASGKECTISLTFLHKTGTCRITIHKGHGAFTADRYKGAFTLPYFQENLANTNLLPTSAIFFHHNNPELICKMVPPQNRYLAMFALPLDEYNFVSDLVLKNAPFVDKNIFKLLRYCVNRQPDQGQRLLDTIRLYIAYSNHTSIDALEEAEYKEAFELTTAGLDSKNESITTAACELLSKLSKTYNYAKLFTAMQGAFVSRLIQPTSYGGRSQLFEPGNEELLKALATTMSKLEPATAKSFIDFTAETAEAPINCYGFWDNVPPSNLNAMSFLSILTNQGYKSSYKAALDFGLKGLSDNNYPIKEKAIDILTALVQHGYGTESYETITQDISKIYLGASLYPEQTEALADKVLVLRGALAEKGHGFQGNVKNAVETLTKEFSETEANAIEEHQSIITGRLRPFELLFQHKQGYKEAVEAAQELWHKKAQEYLSTPRATQHQLNLMFKRESFALLQLLFTYGYGMKEAQELAFNAISKADGEIKSGFSYDSGYRKHLDEGDLNERKTIKDMAIRLLIILVQQQYGQSEDYKSIIAILPTLLEHELSKTCANLCTELFRHGFGVDVVLKIATDRLNNVNQDDRNESFKSMMEKTKELLTLNQFQTDLIAANNAAFKKTMAQYLDLFNLLLQNNKGSIAITEFASALWQNPPTQPRYAFEPTSTILFNSKREAVELFELLLDHGYGIREAVSLAENVLKQIQDLYDLVAKKEEAITEEFKKNEAWQDKEVRKFLQQNISITHYWDIEETTRQLEAFEMLANHLLKTAQKAQVAQEEMAKKAKATREEAKKSQTAQVQEAHVALSQEELKKKAIAAQEAVTAAVATHNVDQEKKEHDERKDEVKRTSKDEKTQTEVIATLEEEKLTMTQTPYESWVCPRCDTENKPPLPGQRAVCIECKNPRAQ